MSSDIAHLRKNSRARAESLDVSILGNLNPSISRPDKLGFGYNRNFDVLCGDRAAQVGDQLRRQRLAAHLHSLGPRALYEFVEEVRAGENADEILNRYRRISAEMIDAAGASSFPPSLTEVPK